MSWAYLLSNRSSSQWACHCFGLAGCLVASVALADIVELTSGGQFICRVLSDSRGSRSVVSIELTNGGQVTLDRRQIERIIPQTPVDADYAKRSPQTPDTVQGQWELAMWCRENKLRKEYLAHLQRVIKLDPEHEKAHQLLGHQKQNGRWLSREELMATRGLTRYDGDFRSRQEIALLERAKRSKTTNADWRGRLDRWRRWLDDARPERVAEAVEAFQTLEDRAAAGPLSQMLANEQNYRVKALLIEAAARIKQATTVQALVQLTLHDEDEETRLQCLEHLVAARHPSLVAPYVKALKSNDNQIVNRAAVGLREIGAQEAISALIDALVTEHKHQTGNASGGDTYSFNTRTGGFQFGGDGPKVVKQQIRNPQVLSALVKLTGENFGYDSEPWQAWLATRAKQEAVDLRRDT